MFRKYRHFARDQRKLAIAGTVEGEFHVAVADLLAFCDVDVVGAVHRAVFLQRIEREDDVGRGNRLAVVPASIGAQPVDHIGEIVGMGRGLRKQAIRRRHFIERLAGQGLVDQADATGNRSLQAGDHLIEIVESTDFKLAHGTALGRVRIDVIEAFEAGRIFDVVEQRHRVPPGQPIRCGLRMGRRNRGNACGKPQRRSHRGDGAALQKMSSGDRQMKNSCC